MEGAIYKGWVAHARLQPKRHSFRYRVFMVYVDCDKVSQLCAKSWLWRVTRKWWPAAFAREDFHGDPTLPLADAVRATVRQQTGKRVDGPVFVLANWRYFGFNINPLTTYYCFNKDAKNPSYILAEVTNTPWRERRAYVLECDPLKTTQIAEFAKQLHVSPFNPMQMQYKWRSNTPGTNLRIHLQNWMSEQKVFFASMSLKRQALTGWNLNRTLISFPFMTVKVAMGIYWQALKLLVKKVPLFDHPKNHAHTREQTRSSEKPAP